MSYFNDCDPYCKPPKQDKCDCACVEDPSIRSLRKQLCRLEGDEVAIVTDAFFGIVTGTVSKVTCGTVELTDAEVFFVDVGRVTVALSKINVLVPDLDDVALAALRAGALAARTQ